MQRRTLFVGGMTCSACESRVHKAVSGLDGVYRAEVSLKRGAVTVEYDDAITGIPGIRGAVEAAGYSLGETSGAGTAIALGIGLLLIAAYLALGATGVFASLPRIDTTIGYAMLFAVGLLTSIHCVAMCGGIALSQSVGSAEKGDTGHLARLAPGALYNAGRVLSYTAIGAIVGAVGSVFNFSSLSRGIIAGIAGAFMVVLGLRMLGVFASLPRFSSIVPAPLRSAGSKVSVALRRGGPFAVGVLNGLMPCGPLQTMQLYALGTGSALAGAFSMFVFSLGTVPLMLLFGLTATVLPRKFVPVMVKASAVLVMFLGAVTFARAAALSGMTLPFQDSVSLARTSESGSPSQAAAQPGILKATVSNGVQTVVTEFRNGLYVPFAVQAGVKLQWTIRVTEADLNGCNNPLEVPEYGIRKTMIPGDNLITFTPKKSGVIAYSCWMGMVRSSITVVDDLSSLSGGQATSTAAGASAQPSARPGCGGGSCCSRSW